MSSSFEKLNDCIDQLVIWLRNNKTGKLLSDQKKRLTNILTKIINSETLTDEEIRQFERQQKQQDQRRAGNNKKGQKKGNSPKSKANKKKRKLPRPKIVSGGLPSLGKRR